MRQQFTLDRRILAIACFGGACEVVALIFAFAHTDGPGEYVIALPLILFAPLYGGLAGAGILFGRPIAGFAGGACLAVLADAAVLTVIALFAHGG